jgi:hypothetical protein
MAEYRRRGLASGAIENPIINSPYREPLRHFATGPDGQPTGEIADSRRSSEFFVPVARPTKRSAQLTLDAFGGPTRRQPNEIVNESARPWPAGASEPTRTQRRSPASSSPTGRLNKAANPQDKVGAGLTAEEFAQPPPSGKLP